MKKLLFLLILVIQLPIFSQDPYITIGRLKLRYDADSNMLRIGYTNTFSGLTNLRIGKELNTQLFNINSSQFTWSNGMLNLNGTFFNVDSTASKRYTNWADSTWTNLGEFVKKYRMITLGKRFWHNPNGYYDWKWYTQSVSEVGVVSGKDSLFVINHGSMSNGHLYNYEVFGVDLWSDLDTITISERGLYSVTYSSELAFPLAFVDGGDARDTVQYCMVDVTAGDDILAGSFTTLWKDFFVSSMGRPYTPESNTFSKTFTAFLQPGLYILRIRADLNSGYINVSATNPLISYILLR